MKLSIYTFPLVLTFRLPLQLPPDLPAYEPFAEKDQEYPDFNGYNGSATYDYDYDLYVPFVEMENAARKLLSLGKQYNIA